MKKKAIEQVPYMVPERKEGCKYVARADVLSIGGTETLLIEIFGKSDIPEIRTVITKKEYAGYHGHYIKYSMRNAMDIATLSCSVVSRIDPLKKVLEDVRITFGVAAPVPYRCMKAEEALRGMKIGEELYQKVEELVREEINPRDSWRASKAFRLQIGGEIAKRALKESVRRGMVTGVVVPDVRTTSGENISANGKIYPSSDAENVTGGEQS